MAFAQRSADDGRDGRLGGSLQPAATSLVLDNAQSAEAERGYAF